MRLYKEYIKEREGLDMVNDNHCFLTYKVFDQEVIVYDIYCDKEVRGSRYMLDFCNKFYKAMFEKGIKVAYGMTDMSTNGWQRSEKLLEKYGFKFIGIDPENKNIKNYYYEINLGDK